MNTLKSIVAICALGMQLAVTAQDREAEEQAQHDQHLGPSVETPPEPSTAEMRAHMLAMREQMARIRAAQDPAERTRLMDEHMQSMRQHMHMMGETHAGQARGPAGRCADNDATCRMDEMQTENRRMRDRMGMMEGRIESMQQLMREMMDHVDEAQRR